MPVLSPDLVLIVQGGIVQAVYAADPSVYVAIIDYDHLGQVEAVPALVEPFDEMDNLAQQLVAAMG